MSFFCVVIFIKAPTYAARAQIIPVIPPNEEKTIVYVLSKKPTFEQNIQLPEPPVTEPSKPDVFFIKYRNQKEADQAQQSIQGTFIFGFLFFCLLVSPLSVIHFDNELRFRFDFDLINALLIRLQHLTVTFANIKGIHRFSLNMSHVLHVMKTESRKNANAILLKSKQKINPNENNRSHKPNSQKTNQIH